MLGNPKVISLKGGEAYMTIKAEAPNLQAGYERWGGGGMGVYPTNFKWINSGSTREPGSKDQLVRAGTHKPCYIQDEPAGKGGIVEVLNPNDLHGEAIDSHVVAAGESREIEGITFRGY